MRTVKKSWERSFPETQVQGVDWVYAVIEDLAEYCHENGRLELEHQLRTLLQLETGVITSTNREKRH